MNRMKPIVGVALMLAAGAAQLPSIARSAKPDAALAAVEHRQASMKGMRDSLKSLVGFAKGSKTDKVEAKVAGISLLQVAKQLPRLWPVGTEVGVGTSRAKPEIWAQKVEFKARIAAMQAAALAMNRAAASGKPALVAQQLQPLDDACKACHNSYQAKR